MAGLPAGRRRHAGGAGPGSARCRRRTLNSVTRLRIFKGDGSHATLTHDGSRWIVTRTRLSGGHRAGAQTAAGPCEPEGRGTEDRGPCPVFKTRRRGSDRGSHHEHGRGYRSQWENAAADRRQHFRHPVGVRARRRPGAQPAREPTAGTGCGSAPLAGSLPARHFTRSGHRRSISSCRAHRTTASSAPRRAPARNLSSVPFPRAASSRPLGAGVTGRGPGRLQLDDVRKAGTVAATGAGHFPNPRRPPSHHRRHQGWRAAVYHCRGQRDGACRTGSRPGS